MDSSTEVKIIQKQLETNRQKYVFQSDENKPSRIAWIEKLLDTSIEDYRKNAIALILAPYLINIRKCSYEESVDVIKVWGDKCNLVKQLDSNFKFLVNHAIDNAIKNGYRPLKLENLKQRNNQLYTLLIT